jgi:predicted RNase H-like HicB family nuclease
MAKVAYIALVEAGDVGFGVTFPDLEGCVSWGETQDDAVANARDALSLHLEGMAEEGLEIPTPSDLTAIAKVITALHFAGKPPVLYVGIEVEGPDAAERVNVYLPRNLLERIDRFSKASGLNRSGFFGLAARNYMGDLGPRATLDQHQAAVLQAGIAGQAEPGFQREVRSELRPTPPRQG